MSNFRETLQRTATSNDLTAVDVPEWERKVYIRRLSVRETMTMEQRTGDVKVAGLKVLIAALVGEDGERILSDSDEDFELMMDQPVGILMPLLTEAARVNGYTSKELEEAVALFEKSPGVVNSIESR